MTTPRTITHDGITLTISEWAERNNILAHTLRSRLDAGWPIERALFQPRQGGRPNFDQVSQIRHAKLKREFSKLVFAVDQALRTFKDKLDTLIPDEDTGGWVDQPQEMPDDRTYPATQDSL